MNSKLIARGLILTGFALLIFLFAWEVFAEEVTVIEVRRNIPLSDKDPVYKDYFISGGAPQGLKYHELISVVRKIQIRDANGQVVGELMTPVANLKVISVGAKISVARLVKEIPRDDQPMLEDTGVMIGDSIQLQAFAMTVPKTLKKVATAPSPEDESEVNPDSE